MLKGPLDFPLYSTSVCSPSNVQQEHLQSWISLCLKKVIFTVVFLNYTSQSKKGKFNS